MKFPVTGYVVFVYNDKIGAHAPQFKCIDEAEELIIEAVENCVDGALVTMVGVKVDE